MDDPTFAAELAKHSAPVCLPAVELARLRKIESDARAYVVAVDLEQQIGTWGSYARRRDAMQELRISLEHDTDG